MSNREEHLKKVAERQKLAEQQIKRFEAELSEAQKKKNAEVLYRRNPYLYSYCTFVIRHNTQDLVVITIVLLSFHRLKWN